MTRRILVTLQSCVFTLSFTLACDAGYPQVNSSGVTAAAPAPQDKGNQAQGLLKSLKFLKFLGHIHPPPHGLTMGSLTPFPSPKAGDPLPPYVQIIRPTSDSKTCVREIFTVDAEGNMRIPSTPFKDFVFTSTGQKKCRDFWEEFSEDPIAPRDPEFGCSGTVVTIDGETMVLTAAHCLSETLIPNCGDAFLGWAIVFGRHQPSVQADHEVVIPAGHWLRSKHVEACHESNDLAMDWALLRFELPEGVTVDALELRSENLELTTKLMSVKHPLGLPLAQTEYVTPMNLDPRNRSYAHIKISGAVGSSGGGLVDEDGKLAGVIKGGGGAYANIRKGTNCAEFGPSEEGMEFTPSARILEAIENDLTLSDCPSPPNARP